MSSTKSNEPLNELSLETRCMIILLINSAVKSRCDGNNATPHGNILLPLWSQNFIWFEFTLKVSPRHWFKVSFKVDDPKFESFNPFYTLFIKFKFLPFSSWAHILDLIFLQVRILWLFYFFSGIFQTTDYQKPWKLILAYQLHQAYAHAFCRYCS